jgi:hypothetical protein
MSMKIYAPLTRSVAVALVAWSLTSCNSHNANARKAGESSANSGAEEHAATKLPLELSQSRGSPMFYLKIQNPLPASLVVPRELVNGPRNPSMSVFLIVTDPNGKPINRCAIVEPNENSLGTYSLEPHEQRTLEFSRFLIETTYCVKAFRLRAFIGSELDGVSANYVSNLLVVPESDS